jgi:alkanesulfonate monooxygenase SsuD/methylene tetrahydromethanopterin reductase-like flavin-dependent oxidoreductase (luciferase family)
MGCRLARRPVPSKQVKAIRIRFALGNLGPIGTAENLATIARRAESLGYDTLWTVERLLWPLKPQTPYPRRAGRVSWPVDRDALDPLDTLTFAAAHTRSIGLGTSVLNIPF